MNPIIGVRDDTLKDYVRKQMYVNTTHINPCTSQSLTREMCPSRPHKHKPQQHPHSSEYYFSADNLQKDIFMRRKMDANGYLPLTLIASFHRLQVLTSDVHVIGDAVRDSSLLEMNKEGTKVCRVCVCVCVCVCVHTHCMCAGPFP
jgi:hypothetical protein